MPGCLVSKSIFGEEVKNTAAFQSAATVMIGAHE